MLGSGVHSGTGFVISEDGLIITNDHVVTRADFQHAGLVKVTFADGRTLAARLVGWDRDTDVAVLQAIPRRKDQKFSPLRIVEDDSAIHLGMPVYAVGCPLGGKVACTAGIASAQFQVADDMHIAAGVSGPGSHNNPRTRLLQFDAMVQRGSSGSPVVNPAGQVIGIASMLKADSISLAVTGGELATSLRNILGRGYVPRPYIGMAIDEVDWMEWDAALRRANRVAPMPAHVDRAIFVSAVLPGGPAATAGLAVGDIIIAANGKPTPFKGDFFSQLGKEHTPGQQLRLTVLRPRPLSASQLRSIDSEMGARASSRGGVEGVRGGASPAPQSPSVADLSQTDLGLLRSAQASAAGASWGQYFTQLELELEPKELPRSKGRMNR